MKKYIIVTINLFLCTLLHGSNPMTGIVYNFDNYLILSNHTTISMQAEKNKEVSIPATFKLNTENRYTTLLDITRPDGEKEQYLFIAFATDMQKIPKEIRMRIRMISAINVLPDTLFADVHNRLETKGMKAVLNIYRKIPQGWHEIASIGTTKDLDDNIIENVHISKIMINEDGDPIIEYRNIPNAEGKIIKKMKVTYDERYFK